MNAASGSVDASRNNMKPLVVAVRTHPADLSIVIRWLWLVVLELSLQDDVPVPRHL
jgi:hypothetical protein